VTAEEGRGEDRRRGRTGVGGRGGQGHQFLTADR